MRIGAVINPVAGDSEPAALRDLLKAHDAEIIETTEDDPGHGQAESLLEGRTEIVLACGGDGTVRAVAEALVGSGIPLGVIPAGTGNLLARNLGIPEETEDALEVALEGTNRILDVGEANGEVFAVMAGIGFDAEIMEQTDRESKEKLGSLAYFLEGVKHLADDPFSSAVKVDGGEELAGEWMSILIGNLGELQGGVDLFPEAAPGDGRLDLLGIRGGGLGQKLGSALAAAVGSETEGMERATGTRFEMRMDRPTRYEIDGEPRERTTLVSVTVRPASLIVKVPQTS